MKNVLLPLCLIVLVLSCKRKYPDYISRIEGKYVSAFQTEYAEGKDTLEITALSNESNYFRIIKTVSYHRIREGKLLAVEYGSDSLIGIYDNGKQVLYENSKGMDYLFIPDKRVVIAGNRTYYKIN